MNDFDDHSSMPNKKVKRPVPDAVPINKKLRPVPGSIEIQKLSPSVGNKKDKKPAKKQEKTDEKENSSQIPIPAIININPEDLEIDASHTYLANLRNYFCIKFFKLGKCGYPCKDLNCLARMKQLPIETMKAELKILTIEEIQALFIFCSSSFITFNAFFPILSNVLGTHKLTHELTLAIRVCEKPQFDLTHYKWVVDGLIRAKWTIKEAIDHIITHKTNKSDTANRTILGIIAKNRMQNEYFHLITDWCEKSHLSLDAKTAEAIIFFICNTKRPNCSTLLGNIVKDMSDFARNELLLNPDVEVWLEDYENEFEEEEEEEFEDALDEEVPNEIEQQKETAEMKELNKVAEMDDFIETIDLDEPQDKEELKLIITI